MSDHYIAIFGGAVSGSEAAFQFTQKGIRVAVFDQNPLPYGKIEDGLPKWHVKLRDKEEEKINEKLSHPLVQFIPNVQLGANVDFQEVVNEWGFSAVLLANGAWRDRPLPIEGVDEFEGKGLYYQNPFIYWYNHYHEPHFSGQHFETPDGAIIIGGGLASLDVAKVLMFENVQRALKARGYEVDLFTLDRSIAKVLEELNLTLEDLGVKGCTLYYRRRAMDMPLSSNPTDTPEQVTKAQIINEKIFTNYQSKYLFNFEPLHAPVDKIVENGRLTGIVFRRTEMKDGRLKDVPGSEYEVRTPLVISSIGSLPSPIPGVPMDGTIYEITEHTCCRVKGFKTVFALGNAVTGRGNIIESARHGRQVSQAIIGQMEQEREAEIETGFRNREGVVAGQVNQILDFLPEPLTPEAMNNVNQRISQLQRASGYTGSFKEWVEKQLPVRLEDMIGVKH